MVRRTVVLVAVVLAVVAVWVYFRSTHTVSGRSAGAGSVFTLLSQESPLNGNDADHPKWTTTRRVSVACGPHPTVRGSEAVFARSLCNALAYYASHRPARPCLLIGGLFSERRRVVVSGRLDGHPLRLEMAALCNAPPRLDHAVETIYGVLK